MIQIDDNDLPIDAATKIIKGTRKNEPTPLQKALATALTGRESAADTVDMYSVEEIKEIAEYLMIFCTKHEGDY